MIAKEVCAIIRCGFSTNVAELEYNGLKVVYKQHSADVATSDYRFTTQEPTPDLETAQASAHSEASNTQDDLMYLNPLAYEEYLAQGENGNRR